MVHILAAPQPGYYAVDQQQIWVDELQTALNRARAGDQVRLLPGTYCEPVVLQASGEEGAPITITAHDPNQPPLLDGQRATAEGRHAGMEPLDGDFAFIKLFQVSHIVIERLKFDRCWPSVLFLRAVRNITVRSCQAERGRFFIYARQLADVPCRDLLIEKCQWIQDPDYDMWEGRVDWGQVKASPGYRDHSHLNGAFFGSYNIEGGVTIRDCDIRHAFNGIRMDMDDRDSALLKLDDEGRPVVARNKDVAIYRNMFSFIRDNAIEPETGAQNWYVLNNAFYNLHAVYSTDQVSIRDMFIIGNRVLNDRRPGKPGQQINQGGKIFKFFKPEPEPGTGKVAKPRHNLWSLFNSVQTRTAYVKKVTTTFWKDYYTLLGLFEKDYPEDRSAERNAFHGVDWHSGMFVQGMACTQTGFPDDKQLPAKNRHNCQGGFLRAFDITPFDPVPHAALGGWDGMLPQAKEVPDLRSEALTIERLAGAALVFSEGFEVGAHGCDAFRLKGWPFEEMMASAPQNAQMGGGIWLVR
ncbi:right-handed parallel beta-helix repeat-containing protein [Shimia marina]|uniref:Right handed beta helix domain-containing protein n=1 Tax=Shimia marina TaxID=321267 RepID=A0A0P1FCK1_9RHOB|nr:hypothetical protein [Shimia marina]CUH53506.1 hypothetical protein SHM7688_02960 [Shimia marina]SFD75483.1 hypothetical protein SAMN04488037_102310 [Shimia marina]